MIQYSLEVGICWLLFYAIYILLLRQETFFKFNRIYLVGTLFIGLIIPKINGFEYANSTADSTAIIPTIIQPITVTAQKLSYSLETIVVTAESATSFNIWKFLFMIWAIGAMLACARFMYGIFKISKLTFSNPIINQEGYKIVHTNAPHLPFSFLNVLFWSDFYLKEELEKQRILDHELVHIKKAHSLDNIFIALLLIPFWWIVPLYGYQNAIKTIHEYEADEAVTQVASVPEYGRLLMQYAQSGFQIPMTNSFAFTQLKNRIIMMTQKKSNPKKLWKYITVIPAALVLCIFLANTNPFSSIPDSQANNVLESSLFNNPDPFDRAQIKKELTALFEQDHHDKTSNYTRYNNHVEALKKQYPTNVDDIDALSFEIFKEFTLINNKEGYKISKYELKNGCFVEKNQEKYETTQVEGDVFKVVQTMPRFSNCSNEGNDDDFDCAQNEMLEFVYSNIKYPSEARNQGLEGLVVCRFIVDKNGNVIEPKIVRSIGGGCDEEVLRMVNSFPQWQPGEQAGKNVNVYYNLPVKFKLEGESKKTEEEVSEIAEQARMSGCEDITNKEEKTNCAQKLLLTEIYTNIKYPALARENGIEGVSILRFDVDIDGSLVDPGFKRFIGGNCEEAILTMFDHLVANTEWLPATLADGTPVKSEYILPIKFKLEANDIPEQKITPLQMKEYKLYPNPAKDEMNIVFNPKIAQSMRMEIYDASGKQILSEELGLVDIQSNQLIDVNNWTSGMYFIKFIGSSEIFIDQFQVVK